MRNPVYAWLKANLGPKCCAPLTTTDAKALEAASAIVELWVQTRSMHLPMAFGAVVGEMQTKCWPLAYHAIAMSAEWSTRHELWRLADLPEPVGYGDCKHEPDL